MSRWDEHGTFGLLPLGEDLPDVHVTAADEQAARLAVCSRSTCATDARVLLEALGLVDGPCRVSPRRRIEVPDTTAVGPGGGATPTRGLADRMDTSD